VQPYFERDGAALYRGEALSFLQSLPSASVDAVITDPPYSSGGQFRGDRANDTGAKYVQTGTKVERPDFAGDNRDQRAYAYWCALWLAECLRIAKPGSPICVFTDWRQLPTTTDMIQAGGWVWRGVAVWDKTEAARPMAGRFTSQAEYIVWGSAGAMPVDLTAPVLPGVYRVVVKQRDKFHQTGKPTELMRQIVKICPEGGTILDPFAGSGTTGVAALLERRRFIGCEKQEDIAAVAKSRIASTQPEGTLQTLLLPLAAD
jgi:site-specific DNA-methyltransferase (adenine-specific)